MSKRVLLSGAGGAIGIHVLSAIMEDTDWEVVGIDSFNHHGHFDRIEEVCKVHPSWRERIKVIRHDLTAPFTAREIDQLGQIDYVINLASLVVVGESVDDPVPFVRNNVELMLQILELARKLHPEVFLQFSTDECFGPAGETLHQEWDSLLPSNPYAASKACQEVLAIGYWRSYGVPVVVTNTTNNFGEMAGPEKFSTIVQQRVSKGEKVTIHADSAGEVGSRFYIHSRAVASALLFIIRELPPAWLHEQGADDQPDRYNIVGERGITNLELAEKIAGLMGKPLDYEIVNQDAEFGGHDHHYGLDGSKLAALGWTSPLTFEEGLAQSVRWHEANPTWLD